MMYIWIEDAHYDDGRFVIAVPAASLDEARVLALPYADGRDYLLALIADEPTMIVGAEPVTTTI